MADVAGRSRSGGGVGDGFGRRWPPTAATTPIQLTVVLILGAKVGPDSRRRTGRGQCRRRHGRGEGRRRRRMVL